MIWMKAIQVTNICEYISQEWDPMTSTDVELANLNGTYFNKKNVTSLYLNAVLMWKNKINAWRKLYRGS